MPQQVIGPGTRLPERIHVRATEEERLYVHLLDLQLAGGDALVDPLMRRIEAPRVSDHADQPGQPLQLIDGLGVLPAVGERDLHLHVLARFHALDRLLCVQLRGRTENHGAHVRLRERFAQLRRGMRDAVLLRDFLRRSDLPTDDRGDLDTVDLFQSVEMLLSEGADACDHDPHRAFSRIMWPTAVFDAGT
jgi:hypothetical protein